MAVDIFLERYYNVRERKIGGFSVVNRGGNSRYVGCFERSLVGKLMEFAGRGWWAVSRMVDGRNFSLVVVDQRSGGRIIRGIN